MAAAELGPQGIRVNAICPGVCVTPLFERSGGHGVPDEVLKRAQPVPLVGMPEHPASAALFLASDASAFVSGVALNVDGALTTRGPDPGIPRTPENLEALSFIGLDKGSTGEAPVVRKRTT